MRKKPQIQIYWLRNDLRTNDNLVLQSFGHDLQLPLLIIYSLKNLQESQNPFRARFILESLAQLNRSLSNLSQKIFLTSLSFSDLICLLAEQVDIQKICWTKEFAYNEYLEETQIKKNCESLSIKTFEFEQQTLIAADDLPFAQDEMPFIFTDFRKKVETSLRIRSPSPFLQKLPQTLDLSLLNMDRGIDLIASESHFLTFDDAKNLSILSTKDFEFIRQAFNRDPRDYLLNGGESEAKARLEEYFWSTKSLSVYKQTRNGMTLKNDSSKFSPWLNSGCLSPRVIYEEIKKFEVQHGVNESTYWLFFELLWRDYFKFFSRKYKNKMFLQQGLATSTSNQDIPPRLEVKKLFLYWCEAQTGNVFIDANMNELKKTGWMSNRGRQNVASYLIHQLQVPWTWGARYFEKKLIDYDPDLNWGNWLYLSGKGSDPRARQFNVAKQAEQYDADGSYRKKWSVSS